MKYQIIKTDNFGRDGMAEEVVLVNAELEKAQDAAQALNDCTPIDGPDFFKVEPMTYIPCKSFAP